MKYQEIPELEDFLDDLGWDESEFDYWEFEERHDTVSKRIDKAISYAQLLNEKIENGDLSYNDTGYIQYIKEYTRIYGATSRFYRHDLRQLFEHTDQPGPTPRQNSEYGKRKIYGPFKEEVYFVLFCMYADRVVKSVSDPSEIVGEFNKYGEHFQNNPVYQYYKSKGYQQGFTSEHYSIAIQAANKTIEDGTTDNPLFFSSFSECVIEIYYNGKEIEIDSESIPNDKEKLLKLGEDYIEKAITLAPEDSQFYAIRGSILKLRGKFIEAEQDISSAIRLSEQVEGLDTEPWGDYRQMLRDLRQERRYAQRADIALSRAREEIQELEKRREKLEERMEKYRNQTLQFIGFFSGIIAIVVTSAQAVLSLGTVGQAGQAMLILTGGLITSFSTLGFILDTTNKNWKSPAIVALLGLLLISVGAALPGII